MRQGGFGGLDGGVDVFCCCSVDSGDGLVGTVRISMELWKETRVCRSYAGSKDTIVWPLDEGRNSLLMNRPVGCWYCRPLGVVMSTKRESAMFSSYSSLN